MKSKYKILSSLALLALALLVWNVVILAEPELEEMSYVDFISQVDSGAVSKVEYSPSEEYMTVYLIEGEGEVSMRCLYPAGDGFREKMLLAGVDLRLARGGVSMLSILELVMYIAPIGFLIYLMCMLSRQMHMGLNKKNIAGESTVRFDNVIGQNEILDDIKFLVKMIKTPELGRNLGVAVPRGILLVGPPGTGKTLIAKAIAGEAGVPFLQMAGSDFKELYVGMGAKRVRELFEEARKKSPCVIFVDEIDAVGSKRQMLGSNSEDTQTVNALLKEMDGFQGREGIFVIAATNNVESLDPALIRAGRFDRQIMVNPPRDWNVRAEMFRYYLRNVKVSDDVDVDALSRQVVGFTGADISTVCNEAGIVAMMHDKEVVDRACIEEAIDRKVFHGSRSRAKQAEDDRRVVAYHEAGHAVMSYLLGEGISRVSMQSTTSGVGGAVFGEDDSRMMKTKTYMEKRAMICYAGRIAESEKFGDVTTGAANDIQKSTEILQAYVCDYGFSDVIGCVSLDAQRDRKMVDEEVSRLSGVLYGRAEQALRGSFNLVERLAVALLERETLSGDEVKEVLADERSLVSC